MLLHPIASRRATILHMKLSKSLNNQTIERPKPSNWFISDDRVKLAIPVGPRFQAEVPPWTFPVSRRCITIDDCKSDDSKWIGTQIWPTKERSQDANNSMIGRGRPEACECASPGSIECVRHHVSEKTFRLQIDLGPVFWKWKFDEMGEDVSKLWNPQEQKKFEQIVRTTAKSQDSKSFIVSAQECFPGHSRWSIVSYYLNVYIPRRISVQTRLGYIAIDTDDDGEDMVCLKGGRKRLQANGFSSSSCKYVKTAYLTVGR